MLLQRLSNGHVFPPEPRHPSAHASVVSLQTRPLLLPPHSLSVRQVLQRDCPLQMPLRQLASLPEQASKRGKPQRLSAAEQTPDKHTRWATTDEQSPLAGAADGIAWSLPTFGEQTPASVHQPLLPQSASRVHSRPHAPVCALQVAPFGLPRQSLLDVQTLHDPAAPPIKMQSGSAAVGQAWPNAP